MANIIILPLFILVLFLALLVANTEICSWEGKPGSEKVNFLRCMTEGEISYNNSGEIYRDGIIDNFKHFKNIGYPAENIENKALF